MLKIKDKNPHLAMAIKENYSPELKAKDIASLSNISKQRVNYWILYPILTRKTFTKLTPKENKMLPNWSRDKPIME